MKTKLETAVANASLNAPLTSEEFAAVEDILMEQLDIRREQIVPNADIKVDLGADSLDQMEIVMKAEERFNLTIVDDQAEPVQTVEDLCVVLAKLLGR